MTGTENAARPIPMPEITTLGTPGVDGRWQPTRAGVVNSWAWADETLLFADGWLALAGPNGSGKSLTASMLVTVLLDAETSQTALSVSGKASGTLTSRHTDRNEREDRTGAWWLEYGLRDEATERTEYLTTGLWLRSTGSTLHRAFFILPGRVGHEVVLRRDRESVRIADLAEQLAAGGGELFTSQETLRSQVSGWLPSVGDERDFRQAIRTRLFAPLDEVQFDALIGILRSLRSVRTAEAISPAKMREVLTEALPALEPDQLALIAQTMERIAELENQLDRARTEARLLDDAHRLYRRYLNAVAHVQAAELSSANHLYDEQTRKAKAATEEVRDAQAAKRAAEARLKETREQVAFLDGELSAADTTLKDHAGAELPLREQRAVELDEAATEAEGRAEEAAQNAKRAAREAEEAADEVHGAQTHLNNFIDRLRRHSAAVGADSAFDRILAALRELADAVPAGSSASLDLDMLCATPFAWIEARNGQVRRVQDALHQHSDAQQAERTLGDARRRAEDAESAAGESLEGASEVRRRAEHLLVEKFADWTGSLRRLHPPKRGSDAFVGGSADDRLPVEQVRSWLDDAVAAARERIDLVGRRHQAATDAALAAAAAQSAAGARRRHAEALTQVSEDQRRVDAVRAESDAEAETDEERRARAHEEHSRVLTQAEASVIATQRHRAEGEAIVFRVARDWLAGAHGWRDSLAFLDPGAIPLPGSATAAASADLHALDPATVRLAAHDAHAVAAPRLHDRVAAAREGVQKIAERIDALEGELAQARRAAPVPAAPVWRKRAPDDGTPLWALVDFADHLSPSDADRIEGALLVSGLLDALVTPNGSLTAGDLVLSGRGSAAGRTLAHLLRPERQVDVPEDRIWQILRAVPVDADGTDPLSTGTFVNGVLTASSPAGYRAAFIGRTARERARRQRVSDLEERLSVLEGELVAAQRHLRDRQADLAAAAAERDALPPAEGLPAARERLAELTREQAAAEQQATRLTAQAELALGKALADLEARAAQRAARLARAESDLQHAVQIADAADAAAVASENHAEERAQASSASGAAQMEAERAQEEADAERSRFPDVLLEGVVTAQEAEDRADDALTRARSAVIDAAEQHRKATGAVKEALRDLNRAAALPDGSLLPTSRAALDDHVDAASSLEREVRACASAAQRCDFMLSRAGKDAQTATRLQETAAKEADAAARARRAATREQATVQKIRELYGTEYQRLLHIRQSLSDQLDRARALVEKLVKESESATGREAAAQSTLDGIAPQRAAAERHRDQCLRRLGRLVDERLAAFPDDLPADPSGRPANLTAGLTWARRLLADKPAGAERLNILTQNRNRALTALENGVRTASSALARFNRQVVLVGIEDTEWRRAVIAEPDATRGEDLDLALQALNAGIAQLEADLRDDVKQTMKTGMFTKLRRDIQVRREAARELVRQIRSTLREVRTGVANVGVQVAWDVRKDEDAQRMVDLISQKPSDEIFGQMYSVLRQRMDETVGEPWPDRVAHTFDYRAWHDWDISVTHSSFGEGATEVFKKVSPRSNPLESLSTGERRLATMLPLLAAAWSMYSGESYRGPRLLSIDEIDAAFDEPNLRQVLALLRMWEFDVLATTPSMAPMIKREAGRAMVHEVVAAGRQRITVPWLWEGHGDPRPLTLDLDASR
ncbi:SbcC/MukB-like Walker B domain-containing protein [Actinomadura nitritigenes]|uniref:SbcC/MukB-like Walker B domain-containing protein n=1 Tax=Actinomadura nitritigenes TaxID=134602 RepID=UPI003D930EA2